MKSSHSVLLCLVWLALMLVAASPSSQALNPNPPDEVVPLIFIHHSCGENWLTEGYGNLGRELGRNNYYVSDTNYGWGPDSIGDRTDIPNWIEWFRSAQTPTYMNALYNESGQNSSYTRSLANPGGENRIIMFKSCYPNSELEGNPNDSPGTYEELSVSGAKYVYNQLLQYFATRPDKLFIVITAPPVSSRDYARNARAFNTWMVEDWLEENNYTLPNVAVFDFYNVLTDRNAHHRYNNGTIEHIVKNNNTLAYPSGDDHPSEQGSRKATEEFIPLLNVYYNRWKATAPATQPASAGEPLQVEPLPQDSVSGAVSVSSLLIDDFEGGIPARTYGWEPFWDEATSTSIRCETNSAQTYSGSYSLLLDFNIATNSWATCTLTYENTQDWSSLEGLAFSMHAQETGVVFDVNIYAGSDEVKETYLYTIETPSESINDWVTYALLWSDFHRADWEEDAGETFSKPHQIIGISFGMNTYPDTPNSGTLWVDDIFLQGIETAPVISKEEEAAEKSPRGISLPCGSAFALPVMLIILGLKRKRQPVD